MTGRWMMASIQMTFSVMPAADLLVRGLRGRAPDRRPPYDLSARSSPSRPCRPACSRRSAACSAISVDVQSSLALFDRIFEYLDLPDRHRRGHARRSSAVRGEVRFEDVWFRYGDGAWALEGIDLDDPAGDDDGDRR